MLPRLWSFLSHNATQVRLATMKSLMTLTSTQQLSYSDSVEDIKLLQDSMRHIFQRAMVEPDEEIQNIIKKVGINKLNHLCNFNIKFDKFLQGLEFFDN